MLQTLIFICFTFVFFLFPGVVLLGFNNTKTRFLSLLGMAYTIGMSVFLYTAFIIRYFQLPQILLYLYGLVFTLLFLKKQFRNRKQLQKIVCCKEHIVFVVVAVLLSVSLILGHLFGHFAPDGLVIVAARDSFWRLSIINELIYRFPPQIPGFSGVLLKNYHFFYDFLIATTYTITHIPVIDLYFHYFAPFSAFLFVLCTYIVIRLFVKNIIIALFGLVITIATGNLSFLLPFISSQYNFFARANLFMSDHPFDQSYNPFNLLAYALFLASVVFVQNWGNKTEWRTYIPLALLIAILPGIKIYAGIIAISAVGLLVLIRMIQRKRFIWHTILSVPLTLPILSVMKGNNFSILSFSPGWLLTKMIQDHDRLFLKDIVSKEIYYKQTGNIPRFLLLKCEQLIIYFVGNLNIRIIAVGNILKPIWKSISETYAYTYISIATIIAFVLPLLFSQTRGVYDSIQFTPYGLLLSGVLSIIVLNVLIEKLRRHIHRWFFVIFGLVSILIAVPTTIDVFRSRMTELDLVVDTSEVAALAYIQKISSANSVILTDMSDEKMRLMYVPALSGRQVFLSGTALSEQVGIDIQSRKEAVSQFFTYGSLKDIDQTEKLSFLHNNHISYIYLSKEGLRHRSFLEKGMQLHPIYENSETAVYQVL